MLKHYDIQSINNLKIHGRTITDASPLPIFWSHGGIEVNVTGTELWADVEINCDVFEPWMVVELNGSIISRQMLLPETTSVCLYRSMQPGPVKNVKFYRDLQAVSGDTETQVLIKGLRTDGEFLPVDDGKLKIEFIGDSITSGEGTYGAFDDMEWLAMYQSSSRTYVNMIERGLKAEARVISHGGWGVYCGWDNDVRNAIPKIYKPVCGISTGEKNEKIGAQRSYDFNSWKPDVVVVNLGTNDCTSFETPPFEVPGVGIFKNHKNEDGSFVSEDIRKIEEAIINFLKMLRECNPKSRIIWCYGMLGYDLEPKIKKAISEYIDETKDDRVEYLSLPCSNNETYGSHMHPGFKNHHEAAIVLGRHIGDMFGLEFKEPLGGY